MDEPTMLAGAISLAQGAAHLLQFCGLASNLEQEARAPQLFCLHASNDFDAEYCAILTIFIDQSIGALYDVCETGKTVGARLDALLAQHGYQR